MLNDKGEEVGIIYGWYCIPTSMWYIGQTIDEEGRFKRHIKDAFNRKDNIYFHRALRKYGLNKFVYCVIEENVLIDNLNMREMDWIEYYDSFYSGYNLTLGGDGAKGSIMSKDTRKKISDALKGRKKSKETRKKLSESLKGQFVGEKNPMYNKHHSEEARKKNSEAHKGIPSPNRRKVSKYDLYGNFIKEYNCMIDAIKENPKCSNISKVCRGERKQAGGFIWKYA